MANLDRPDAELPELDVQHTSFQGSNAVLPACLYLPRAWMALPDLHRLPILLYFHGGGFVRGSIKDAHAAASFIARHCPAIVMAAAYSLAPVHPFPNAPEDAYAALGWIKKHAASLGGDPSLVAVAGDDAGGNLAASLSFIARDRQAGTIRAQALIAPMLDPSMTRLDNTPGLQSDITLESCARCYSQYLPQSGQRMHPYAAPLESRRLKGMPPALILTAGRDLLHIEAEKYASALIDAGVPTQFRPYADVTRGGLPAHEPALAEITDFLRRHFYRGLPVPFSSSSRKESS